MLISPGARLGSYEVLSPLGACGMSEVCRARDEKLGREAVVKAFTNYENALTRTEACARSAGVLGPYSIDPCSI